MLNEFVGLICCTLHVDEKSIGTARLVGAMVEIMWFMVRFWHQGGHKHLDPITDLNK